MSKETVLALVAGVATLLLGVFYFTSDSSSDPASLDDGNARVGRRERHERSEGERGAAREQRGGEARARSEPGEDGAPADERTTREERGGTRRRAPAAIGASGERARMGSNRASREVGGEQFADSPRSGGAPSRAGGVSGGGGVSRPRLRDNDDGRDRPELPEARDDQPVPADVDPNEEVPEAPAEPIREIAYQQDPDRLFDTGVPMEVQGAGRVSPDAGTVSFWMQPEWAHNKEDSADIVRLGETGLQLVKEGSFLRFEYNDAQGNEQGGDADIGQWQDGEWHHVIATWTREGMYLYVDGGQAFANQGGARPAANSDPRLFVGSSYPDGTGVALAAMANMTVINRTSSVDDVQKMFAAGGPVKK
jgi:hypothetical protein